MAAARRTNLGPLERGLSLALGALAASAAIRSRRAVPASLLGTAGGLLLYRGISGYSHLYGRLGISGSEVGGTVSACSQVTVQREPHEVHHRLRDPGDLHQFSRYVTNATEVGDGLWRLRLETPAEGRYELIVRRTAEEEGQRLAWATEGEGPIPAALELRFTPSRTGTEIHADLWFVPPGPPVVARTLRRAEGSRPLRRAGLGPSQLLEQELRRLRQVLEAGETATVKGQSAGGRRARRDRSTERSRVRELA